MNKKAYTNKCYMKDIAKSLDYYLYIYTGETFKQCSPEEIKKEINKRIAMIRKWGKNGTKKP